MRTEVDERDIYAALMVVEDIVLLVDRRPEWMADAACRGTDTNVFFPAKGESRAPACEFCAGCPVRAPCAEYAAERTGPLYGIWGGMTPLDRLRGRRRRVI